MILGGFFAQAAVTAEQVAARAEAQNQAVGATLLFIAIMVIIFGYMLPFAIVLRRLFLLSGHPGNAAFIPGYNFFVLGDIAKAKGLSLIVIVSMVLILVPIVIFVALPTFLITAAMLVKRLFDQYDQTISFWIWLVFAPAIAVFKMKDVEFSGLLPTGSVVGGYVVPDRQQAGVPVFGGAVTAASGMIAPPPSPGALPITFPIPAPQANVVAAEDSPLLPPAFAHPEPETGYNPMAVGALDSTAPPEAPQIILHGSAFDHPQAEASAPVMPEQPPMVQAPLPPAAFVPSVNDPMMRPPVAQPGDPFAAESVIGQSLVPLPEPMPPALQPSDDPFSDNFVMPETAGLSLADLEQTYAETQGADDQQAQPAEATDLLDPSVFAPTVEMQPDLAVAPAPAEEPEEAAAVEQAALVPEVPAPPAEPPAPEPPKTDYQDSDGVLHIDHHNDKS